jgi:hypothetical protein
VASTNKRIDYGSTLSASASAGLTTTAASKNSGGEGKLPPPLGDVGAGGPVVDDGGGGDDDDEGSLARVLRRRLFEHYHSVAYTLIIASVGPTNFFSIIFENL